MTDTKAPVVFIHGLWLHATSWAPWQELFAESGYEPVAPGWPGDADTVEATRADPDSVANKGIDEVTDHYAKIIDGLPAARAVQAPDGWSAPPCSRTCPGSVGWADAEPPHRSEHGDGGGRDEDAVAGQLEPGQVVVRLVGDPG